jgi:phosphatidylglycerol:prolipoprotein diacylglycerol transferase
VLAAIPYTTFPEIDLGPVSLRSFGLLVAAGVVAGAVLGARLGERWGVSSDETFGLATRLVIAGVVGARLTWVVTHLDQIDSPLDVVAVWQGGLQFSGGFILAILVGIPVVRKWGRLLRWRMLDAVITGLALGICIGRLGCYAVGEHLGRDSTSFFLAVRYEGGATREGPPLLGQTIHNAALYEFLHLGVLTGLLLWLVVRRRAPAGTAVGVFCLWYGVARFATDFLRGYDDTVAGLTGAQFMCLALIPAGIYILARVRPRLATLAEEETDEGDPDPEAPDDPAPDGVPAPGRASGSAEG